MIRGAEGHPFVLIVFFRNLKAFELGKAGPPEPYSTVGSQISWVPLLGSLEGGCRGTPEYG